MIFLFVLIFIGSTEAASLVQSSAPKQFHCNFEDSNRFTLKTKWNKNDLTYYISNGIRKNPRRNAIRDAFKLWATSSPLSFTETRDKNNADMKINYEYLSENILGQAWFPPVGVIQMDADQQWTTGRPIQQDFMTVVAHEIGHAIGIGHSRDRGSVMLPSYTSGTKQHSLGADDKAAVRKLYGNSPNSVCRQIRGAVINLNSNVNMFTNKPVDACCNLCENEPGCYGYNWTPSNGGTCHLKSKGEISRGSRWSNWITGYLEQSGSPSSGCHQIRGAVINLNRNLNMFTNKPVGDCCKLCENEPGCYGYNWIPSNGGTCHLKPKGEISRASRWSNWITGYRRDFY